MSGERQQPGFELSTSWYSGRAANHWTTHATYTQVPFLRRTTRQNPITLTENSRGPSRCEWLKPYRPVSRLTSRKGAFPSPLVLTFVTFKLRRTSAISGRLIVHTCVSSSTKKQAKGSADNTEAKLKQLDRHESQDLALTHAPNVYKKAVRLHRRTPRAPSRWFDWGNAGGSGSTDKVVRPERCGICVQSTFVL
ncbi:hypothetical protein Bbelb_311090 [Branchiostoma belcheri]|nr:hypothetical protein Bbelb_311090 [Branchiostoma belcheri]